MTQIRLLLSAVQYFTRVPVPRWVGHAREQLTSAARYLPAVGLLVGVAGAAVFWLASLVFPAPLPAILSTTVTILMTGAFHEDGLADTFDGLGGGLTRERALEIMKDSRVGAFGVIALVLVLALKIAALSVLPLQTALLAIVAGHTVSRFCAVVVLFVGKYVGDSDSSRAAALVRLSGSGLVVAGIVGLAPLALLGLQALIGLAAAGVALIVLHRWCTNRIGGFTGDTLGATQQITEVTLYLGVYLGTGLAIPAF
jgi:adenosylcobinamide-GDP ribazoletransferase